MVRFRVKVLVIYIMVLSNGIFVFKVEGDSHSLLLSDIFYCSPTFSIVLCHSLLFSGILYCSLTFSIVLWHSLLFSDILYSLIFITVSCQRVYEVICLQQLCHSQ